VFTPLPIVCQIKQPTLSHPVLRSTLILSSPYKVPMSGVQNCVTVSRSENNLKMQHQPRQGKFKQEVTFWTSASGESRVKCWRISNVSANISVAAFRANILSGNFEGLWTWKV
jgi:hypothetical protein